MRKLRQLSKDATYHVTSKINRDENIFDEEEFKILFLDVVKRAKKKYDFELKNFSIMPNHIHFLLKPLNNSSLSRIMQWILSVFAVYYNKEKEYSGHVWKGRFFSKIIEDVKQLINTFRYISDNPVKAGLVARANDYRFGGLYQIKMRLYDLISKPSLKSY
jgi:REP element-mobilizing transposase RayT